MAYQPKFLDHDRNSSRENPEQKEVPIKPELTWKKVLVRIAAVILCTLLMAVAGLYGVMYVFAKGPSPTARTLFVRSVRETSAVYWLANLFFTPEQIAEIENVGEIQETEITDASLINIPRPEERQTSSDVDAWGLRDEDGDGLILQQIHGTGFVGYLLVVLDPSRMMLGSAPTIGAYGMTLDQMCQTYGCVAGINGGGFQDKNGSGDGRFPDGMMVRDGEIYFSGVNSGYAFVGFDKDFILHTGFMTEEEIVEQGIQFGCSFGPVLVANGQRSDDSVLASGVNPRTAIGQRSDGAVLLLVIDGRQAHSLGATYGDAADVMLEYGAVNACNLDGGSSTSLWYNGEWVNSNCSVVGMRPLPTGFLVKEAMQ